MGNKLAPVIATRCTLFLLCVGLLRLLLPPTVGNGGGADTKTESRPKAKAMAMAMSQHLERFVEVPQMEWGLNNQKIALARAALTARMLNRTLLLPTLSAHLTYKSTPAAAQPLPFDAIFSVPAFNRRCRGFVHMARLPPADSPAVIFAKGGGRRWTPQRDMAQLREMTSSAARVVRIRGKNPFVWHDHWPLAHYARVLRCLRLRQNISADVARVVDAIRRHGAENPASSADGAGNRGFSGNDGGGGGGYVAVHMRVEKDWRIHCGKVEARARQRGGEALNMCADKDTIIERVARILGRSRSRRGGIVVVYLAMAEALLENEERILKGWAEHGLVAVHKRTLGVADTVYAKYPYVVQAAIDYEVCKAAAVFVGNSFSTFSSILVMERSAALAKDSCSKPLAASYAYNVAAADGGAARWSTNFSESSLQSVSYGTNHVSCSA